MSAYLWPLSRTTVLDLNGDVVPGAWLNFWVAGTTTPLVTYRDSALTAPHPVVIEADAAGRLPAVYMPYTDYRQRVRTPGGTLLFDDDGIANPAPATSGGGGSVPAEQLIETGDLKFSVGSGSRPGYVRLNGRTLGSAGSGATERANADCEDLYIWIWNNLANDICPVAGGRGGSGAADFAANKTIQLIDGRCKGPFGVDGMGSSLTNGLNNVPFTNGGTQQAGSSGGAAMHTLSVAELAPHPHSISLNPNFNDVYTLIQTTGVGVASGVTTVNSVITNTTTTTPNSLSISGGTGNAGSGSAHNNMPPFLLGTWYQKL
jgi:microcystin-dependent protein